MSYSEDDLRTLTRLGLSVSQSKVYITIAKAEPANAKTIWKLTEVGRQDIYRVLLELQKKGLVERIIASPSMYRAIPLEEGVSILLERKKDEANKLSAEAQKMVKKHQCNETTIHLNGFQLVFIPENEALVFRLHQSVGRIRETADILSSLKRWATGIEILEEEMKKGVQTRGIVVTDDRNWLKKLKQPFFAQPNLQMRSMPPHVDADYCIYDKREAYISTNPEDGDWRKARCLWTNYPSIIKLLQDHFEMRWSIAKENVE